MKNPESIKNMTDVFDQVEMKYFCVENDTINPVKKKNRKNICNILDRRKIAICTSGV